jgi:hypothetical protein
MTPTINITAAAGGLPDGIRYSSTIAPATVSA